MQNQMSTMSITMPRIKISHFEQSTFLYQIDIATRWGKWHLQKKYSQFQQLHENLKREFNDLPQFPQSFFNKFMSETQQQATEYQQILQIYMQETSKRKDIINSIAYTQFLNIAKNAPALLANKPKFLKEFQIQQRINDQGKVILDFHYDENYIVFATGNDSPVQKFNSLIANSKFPWEEQEQIQYVLPLGTIECWLKKKENDTYKRVWSRNYPIETRCFIFSLTSATMIVGLSDGSVQIFKLIQKPRYIYYQLPTMVKAHEDDVLGVHLDQVNMNLYSVSVQGWVAVIDVNRNFRINTFELSGQATFMKADPTNMRIYIALAQGNIDILQYTHNAKTKVIHSLSLPVQGQIKCLLFDSRFNYLFAGSYQSGQIFIFEIGKRGYEKVSKQIGYLKNKEHIIDMIFQADKMELLVSTLQGQIFFWNTVKGQQIYMLKAFTTKMSISKYIRQKNLIITASRGRFIKFWEIPSSWRDVVCEVEEEKEMQIRRKVDNLYKVRQALKRKEINSDEDDLKGWHWNQSDSQEDPQ